MICIFDIETIPDIEIIKKDSNYQDLSDYEATIKYLKNFEEESNTTFLPLTHHKIVALSAVIANDNFEFITVGEFGKNSDKEEDIISHFFSYVEDKNPKFVTFNGRGFDIPLLLIRALKYNLSFRAFFEQENYNIGKNKWENYRQRYSEKFHLDLYDSIGQFGSVRNISLDKLSLMMNLPGKYSIDGSDVLDFFYQGKLNEIKEYCQSDTLNTYWLFLKYSLLQGLFSKDRYYELLEILKDKLDPKKSYFTVFRDAIKKELSSK